MPNTIAVANVNPSNFIDPTSRYAGLQILYYGDQNYLTFETYKRHQIVFSPDDKYYVITKRTEYRPDLLSNDVYGVSTYWWRIMEANNIFDIWDFKVGRNIRIPALTTVAGA